MGINNFIDNFIGGLAFGMMANNPCFGGFGYFGAYSNSGRVDFGTFANPFPTIFSNMQMNNSMMVPPIFTDFGNPDYPAIDFSNVTKSIWDNVFNPESELNKRTKQYLSNMGNSQYKSPNTSVFPMTYQMFDMPFSGFYNPIQTMPYSYEPSVTDAEAVKEEKKNDSSELKKVKLSESASNNNEKIGKKSSTVKLWTQMSDNEMREIYGNYSRDITTKFNGTAADLNKFINRYPNSVLKGKGDVFIRAQEKYGINAAILLAISGIETSYGTTGNSRPYYNVVNIEKPKKASYSGRWRRFNSPDECIMELARLLKENYVNNPGKENTHLTKLYQVNAKYCPAAETSKNSGWAMKVEEFYNTIQSSVA